MTCRRSASWSLTTRSGGAIPRPRCPGEGVAHLRVWLITGPEPGHLGRRHRNRGLAASVTESAGHIWAELAGRRGPSLVLLEHSPAPGAGDGRGDPRSGPHRRRRESPLVPASGRPRRSIPVTPGWSSGWPFTDTSAGRRARAELVVGNLYLADALGSGARVSVDRARTEADAEEDLLSPDTSLLPPAPRERRLHVDRGGETPGSDLLDLTVPTDSVDLLPLMRAMDPLPLTTADPRRRSAR